MGSNQTKELLHSKRNYHQSEQATYRVGENFKIYPSKKGLYPDSVRNLNKFTRKKNIKKWVKDMNRHFSKEDIYRTNKHAKMLIISRH